MSRFKNSFTYFIIILISYLCYLPSKVIYDMFSEKYLPVFDGVMYENKQIIRYLNFKDNFSFLERINQAIYEFTGNPVSGGFNSFLILLDPNFLINDIDIALRAIFAVFSFLVSIKVLL